MPHTGSCLCKAVTVEIKTTHSDGQILCHCSDCQYTSGSHASTNILVKETDVKWTGAVKEYISKAASGNNVIRGFCSECGSSLYHNTVAFGDSIAVQTGTLPDFRTVPFVVELFVKDRWTGIGPVAGAEQAWIMPGSQAPSTL